MAYKGVGIKQRKRFINVYILNKTALCLLGSLPVSTIEGGVNHPTLGHKTKFQWGVRSSSDQDTSPHTPTNTWIAIVNA